MKILTLFLALFLALLPDDLPYTGLSQSQDFCTEAVDEVEEEAVIQLTQRIRQKPPASPPPALPGLRPTWVRPSVTCPVPIRFERQWLLSCSLRL